MLKVFAEKKCEKLLTFFQQKISILYIESIVNEMALKELVKLTML